MAVWSILRPFGIFVAIWYILWSLPALVCCTKKNLATLKTDEEGEKVFDEKQFDELPDDKQRAPVTAILFRQKTQRSNIGLKIFSRALETNYNSRVSNPRRSSSPMTYNFCGKLIPIMLANKLQFLNFSRVVFECIYVCMYVCTYALGKLLP
jgi:hypothetical protein